MGGQGLLDLPGLPPAVRENLRATHRRAPGAMPRRWSPARGKTLRTRPPIPAHLRSSGRPPARCRFQNCRLTLGNENKILVAAHITATKGCLARQQQHLLDLQPAIGTFLPVPLDMYRSREGAPGQIPHCSFTGTIGLLELAAAAGTLQLPVAALASDPQLQGLVLLVDG